MTKLGLIAGNGVFPLEISRAARLNGVEVIAVAHQGETDPALAELVNAVTWIKVGELQRMIDVFKEAGVQHAAMAGGIARASLPGSFAPDARALAMLGRIGRFSDDAVLRGVASEIEADGIAIIDPIPMLTGVLADSGLVSGPEPSSVQLKDLDLAFAIARTVGRFDIGQAVAVRDGVVAAVEAVEGTDSALRRAAQLCGPGLIIAKAGKPGQDLRFDRPAIGPGTITLLAEIGAAMIGIEAGTTMLLERDRTLERALTLGVTVFGYG